MNTDNQALKMPSHDDSLVITLGLSLLFVVFVLIGGWMGFAPLASSSVAVGEVSAGLDKKTIQHLEGGKITAIYVKDGDKVTKGQILLKLRDIQIKAQLNILSSQYQDAIALFARLEAQRDEITNIIFPAELVDENARKDQVAIFKTTLKTVHDEKIISQNKIHQLTNQISGLYSLLQSKENRLLSITEEKLEWEDLYEQRLADKQKIRELQRETLSINGDIANQKTEMLRLNEQISETQVHQFLREKEFKKDVLERYVSTKSVISDLKSKIIANQDIIDRTSIYSPIDGTIVGFTMHTVGGIVSPSKPILEIIPNGSKLLVVAQVLTTDIDKVRIGLVADVMFSAFNLKTVHVIRGEVVHVSADIFTDQASNMPYYEAKIEVTPEGIEVLRENNFVLVSGMPAQVMINLGDRTALSYLVKPFTEMLTRSLNEE